ncbi:hypothetical protein [Trichoplusia ni ascovirus 6b]|nr:hypothetical protein [Trichoplusia ni ascovirus 6b]
MLNCINHNFFSSLTKRTRTHYHPTMNIFSVFSNYFKKMFYFGYEPVVSITNDDDGGGGENNQEDEDEERSNSEIITSDDSNSEEDDDDDDDDDEEEE